ncbi:unnamed protein product [Hyaloperonospora brassicae]|uniref:RxLR effector candidate protein n=1 Tax=Hyaloperonospora brassicae TaxID=162125 RepID=A0AAV0UNZ5_HYABA|nr:unnamed protein product [Hyaloperonospora brassicae]
MASSTPPASRLRQRRATTSRSASRPPNHPNRRRSLDGYTTATATATNSSSSSARSSAVALGLSMRTARTRLLQAIQCKIQEKEDSRTPTTALYDPFLLLLALCASFRVADAVRRVAGADQDGDARGLTAVAEAAFLVAAAGGTSC